MSIHSKYGIIAAMAVTTGNPKRAEARAARRRQLIDATIRCIANKGLGSTTLGDVARRAGLSQGIVNLHFQSKENLLAETLRSVADDYRTQFDKTLVKSGPTAADKLRAIAEMDLKPSICDRRKLAVWFAFWGEVKSVPTYRKICAERDEYYDEVMNGLCEEIIADGGYDHVTAQQVTDALSSMTDGLWLSHLISPQTWDREQAMAAVDSYLSAVFPRHYG